MSVHENSPGVKPGLPVYSAIDKVWLLIGLGVLVRLVFLGLLDLLPEEAYYWSYAQHLSIGYLDHPPMVAWLIYIFQTILGRSEFAVRMPAFLGWLVFACFMFRFTEDTVGKSVGKVVLVLLVSLPIYMSIGFIMTPDAPLYVCWAGALYFLERAIIGNSKNAWYLAGVFLGLGLLSKYTMGLIVPATVIYLLLDKQSRHWFARPQPYLALIIGAAIFSPVIFWNARHEWMSFAFQGSRRWSGGMSFHLHVLIGSALILITPLGLYEAVMVLANLWKARKKVHEADLLRFRKYLFLTVFTVVPLSVFVVFSIQGNPKLNWTGPVWLAILPLVAARISGVSVLDSVIKVRSMARRWLVTVIVLLTFYVLGFGYLVAGIPGAPKSTGMKLPIAWEAMGKRLQTIESRMASETQTTPLIVGLDKYWLASEASFYVRRANDSADNLPKFAGQKLVGGYSLMWDLWAPPETAVGRNVLLLAFSEQDLSKDWVTRHFESMGDAQREVLTNRFGEIGHFYWRVGYNYRVD